MGRPGLLGLWITRLLHLCLSIISKWPIRLRHLLLVSTQRHKWCIWSHTGGRYCIVQRFTANIYSSCRGKLTHHSYFCEEQKCSQEIFVSSCQHGVCWSVPRSFEFTSIHLWCRLWIPPMDHVRWKLMDQQAYLNLLLHLWHSFLAGLSYFCSVHNVCKILRHTLAV